MIKFDIYDQENHEYIKTDCTLESIIEPNHRLSNAEVRKFFKIDESSRHWERAHRPFRVKRYVFDKCIISDNPRFMITQHLDDWSEEDD